MNRTQKIALGASSLVLAGLVALAVPAVGTLAATPASEPAAAPVVEVAPAAEAVESSPAPTTEPTAPEADAAYLAAVADYPRELPEGYTFPEGIRGPRHLLGADVADKWWWCSQIDAAWEAYFNRDDERAALTHLRAAAEVDPGSFGSFEQSREGYPHTLVIDRDVRFIGDGVDSQYVEYTANGCWNWARSIGAKFVPMS